MDDATCPHCGSCLPVVRDAFCMACHEPLDEPPEVPRTAAEKAAFLAAADRDARQVNLRIFSWFGRLLRWRWGKEV